MKLRFLRRGEILPVDQTRTALTSCDNCRFYTVQGCHRFPPTVDRGAMHGRVWPHVARNDWCGEWKP